MEKTSSLGQESTSLEAHAYSSNYLKEHANDESVKKVLSVRDDLLKTAVNFGSEEEFEKTASMEYYGNVGSTGAVQARYPSPFLTLSDMKIPDSSNEIFQWCKYTYMFDPLIAGSINSLSTFPVTDISFEDIEHPEDNKAQDAEEGVKDLFTSDNKQQNNVKESETLKTYRKVLVDKLKLTKFLTEIGIDYFAYGNCFVFGEMGYNNYTKKPEWKRVVRLNPDKIILDYNAATGEKTYKWQIPENLREIIRSKKPADEYAKIPAVYKLAVQKNQAVILNPNNVYHFSRPSDSNGNDTGWGTPIIANVLKLIMYRNVLRQAQEAIAREHIVPFRIFFLDPTADGISNPQADWANASRSFAAELMKSVRDPNYKVVAPCRVGMINAGGDGRALMLTSEIEQIQSEILAGMNVPREFIFGGVSYSGGSIALKILENNFATYRLFLMDFVQNFLIKGMAIARREWINESDDDKLIKAKFADLKMMDDVQKKQIMINLNGAGKISDEFLLNELGIDAEKMRSAIKSEQLASVEQNLEIQKQQYKSQLDLQVYQHFLQEAYFQKYPFLAEQQNPAQDPVQMQEQQGPNQPQVEDPQNVPSEVSGGVEQGGSEIPQAQAQSAQQEAQGGQEQQSGTGLSKEEENIAKNLLKMPESQRLIVYKKLPKENATRIHEFINRVESQGQQGQPAHAKQENAVDMRPMPTQRPPRRNSLK